MAKGLGGGFPIGACLARKKAAEVLLPGDHGNTFGGNPLACSVALTVISEIIDKDILDNVNRIGRYLMDQLYQRKSKYPIIKDIRGSGLLIGMELEESPSKFQKLSLEKGLLLATAGNNTIRFLPPLNVSKEEIDEMLVILDTVLEEIGYFSKKPLL